ncbi:ankyrin repeat-containing protein [Thermochaetoides thermophila DSM 1495]|uniref:Ankyrin repeat-containing protein n=1 Tax=Chaetomium thermophilum (strain DSM 1495 / CBS 144.50 / IMI 039719) TaxID=759272 RepID=G0S6G3_CHATD|nr:ankyrin repeat-containing protein [Thermochaetoides thermophila DSM 1495]EGS21618.1 ankyrin repeat-containing protein [Thermochaetoides thermophila DSM 1495]
MAPNPYLLAADNPQALISLLREQPQLASGQDEHGYSLVHAAASYNHLDLLRQLIREFKVPVDLKDEDGETALFVVETVDAARVLVEELGLDPKIQNDEGQTAREKFEADGDFPAVTQYLQNLESDSLTNNGITDHGEAIPPLPEGFKVTVGTMDESEDAELPPDPEFRRRIEELAAREDFQSPEGQAELRRLVEEAIRGQFADERNVRPRQD